MLRVGRAVAAVLIVAAVVLVPVPAQAVGGLPVPVEPVPLLPSTTVRMTQGASGTWSVGDYLRAFAYANRSNSVATIPKPATVPLVAPAASWGAKLLAGTNAGAAAFAGGFAIGGAGVALYGTITGADVDSPMCGLADWVQVGYGLLTLGVGPSCKATIWEPNSDVVPGVSMAVGGTTVTYLGVSANGTAYCYSQAPYLPSGQAYSWFRKDGVWQVSGRQLPGANSVCPTPQSYLYFSGATGIGSPSSLRVVTNPGGEVVAAMEESTSDPMRDSTCTLTWPGGSTTTGFVGQYRESEGFPVGAVSAACTEAYVSKPGAGPDLLPERISVGSRNTESGAVTEIADQEVPDYTEAERKGLDPGDGTGLKLWKIRAGTTFSCMTWAIDCTSWWDDTEAGTETQTETGTYRCTFGGKTVDLTECGVYRRTFDDPDIDTGERTITDPDGDPVPWPTPDPIPGPGPVPGPGPGPGPGGGADPSAECFADGWASVANPLDWVLVPVKCALVWAFVPRTTVIEGAVSGIGAAAGNVALVDPLITLLDELPSSSGCSGIPISLTFFGQDWEGRLLDACEGEAAAAATVVNGLMTLALVTGSVLAIARYSAAVFGFVGPGGSIEQAQRTAEVQQRQSGKAGS